MSLLAVSGLYAGYGGADILKGISLTVSAGEIVVVVGPNGAGKSTFIKAVAGLVGVRQGSVRFEGQEVAGLAPEAVVARGVSYVPQERNVFASMTVQENLEMGAFLRREGTREAMERVFALFPRLGERRRQQAGLMSGGERQMVAMGRALMLEPKLLMLDEPTAGLAPAFIDQVFERVRSINEAGIGVLMVEQNAKQALGVAHRGYVFAGGENRHEDSAAAMLADPHIAEMFLGG